MRVSERSRRSSGHAQDRAGWVNWIDFPIPSQPYESMMFIHFVLEFPRIMRVEFFNMTNLLQCNVLVQHADYK